MDGNYNNLNNNNLNMNHAQTVSNLSAGLRNIHLTTDDQHLNQNDEFYNNSLQNRQFFNQQQQPQHQPQHQQQQQQQQFNNHHNVHEETSELREFFNGESPTEGFSLITHKSAPNGFKIAIVLSELNYHYRTIYLDFNKNDHRLPQFLQLNPNGRVPALIDHTVFSSNLKNSTSGSSNDVRNKNNNNNNNNSNDDNSNNNNNNNNNNSNLNKAHNLTRQNISLWESGSIIVYLVNKKLKDENVCPSIWSENLIEQSQILSWLFFQTSGHAPMIGQALHFRYFHTVNVPSAIDRYTDEVRRVYGVLEMALSERRETLIMELDSENAASYSSGLTPLSQSRYFDSPVWLVGDRCTIADLCFVPWNYVVDRIGIDLKAEFPEVYKWTKRMMRRPAVVRALTEG